MKYILELSKQNQGLSQFEATEHLGVTTPQIHEPFLIIDIDKSGELLIKDLANTHNAYLVLFECSEDNLEKEIIKHDWQKHYKKNFSIRCINMDHSQEKRFASLVWKKLEKPKVNLTSPSTQYVFIKIGNKVYASVLEWENNKEVLGRKAHLKPELHPSSLDPRLAKACVNIAVGTKRNARVLDPFCGVGGILIEAGLMKHKAIGYDIDEIMARKAVINLENYKVKGFEVGLKDALDIDVNDIGGNVDAIITDLPYGKNTRPVDIDKLVKKFLQTSHNYTPKMIIMFPSNLNYKKLLGKWKLKREFIQYLHKSLSKRIVVLTK